jgi:hypothetical protein
VAAAPRLSDLHDHIRALDKAGVINNAAGIEAE